MKKLFHAVLASASAVLSVVSCQKNEIVSEFNSTDGLVFSSEKPDLIDETKTAWTGETIKWSTGDAIRVAYTCDDVWQNANGTATKNEADGSKTAKTYQSTSLSADAETAKFSVPGDFKGTAEGTYKFYGAYPASACTDGTNFKSAPSLTVTIPATQTPAADSFDSAADFMLGKSVITYTGIPKEAVSMNWDRMVAHAQLTFKTLKGFTAGETISQVELTADSEADMVGKHYINLDTKNVTKAQGTDANALTINGTNLSVDETGTFVAWVSFLPCTVKSLTVVVTTNKATYTREIASCELVFKKNARNILAINMSEADRNLISQSLNVNFPDLGYQSWGENASFSGITKDVVSQTVSNVRLEYKRNGSNLYANNGAIRFYKSNTLTFVSPEGYYITDIQWTGSGYKNDVTTNVGTCSSSNEALSWTGNAKTVTFTRPNDGYITLSSVTVSLAKDSRTPLATPTVTATLDENVTNSIIVSWNSVENAGSYVVTATPSTETSVSKTETVTTKSCTITGLSYETTYTISVIAKPSDSSKYMDSKPGICNDKIKTGVNSSTSGILTTTLSNANITAVANPNNSAQNTAYRQLTYKDNNAFEYSAYAISTYHSKATNQNCYIQIKAYANSTAYYVKLPQFTGNIKSIHLVVSGSSKTMNGAGNTATIYFSASNSTSADGANIVSGKGDSEITIDASSLNLNTGYLTSSGAVRIWEISVEYYN